MQLKNILAITLLSACTALAGGIMAADMKVGITPSLKKFQGTINGRQVTIMRNQNSKNTVNAFYAKTSRPCPPFCIQPIRLAPGVETVGEIELIGYLKKMAAGDKRILVIDSRTPDWVTRGTIPGAINIPWTRLNVARGADPLSITDILTEQFGVKETEGLFDYSEAKTLIMFCNGMWCGQSPSNIRSLLRFGYPANKIKWYRGGMQDWESLGLSTVKP